MSKTFLHLFCLLFYLPALAQHSIPFELSYSVDSSRQVSFEKAPLQKYLPAQAFKNLGFVGYPVWVRLRFSRLQVGKEYYLEARARADSIIFGEGKTTGDVLPFSTRPIEHHNILLPLALPAQATQEMYICLRTHTQVRLNFTLWEARTFQAKSAKNTLFYGFLYGIMALMIVYNFFTWRVVRDTAYLYYIGFAFFMLLVQSSQHLYQYILGDYPIFNNQAIYYFVGGVNFCAGNFGRLFLDTKKYAPRLSKLMWYVSFYGFAVMLCATFFSFSFTSWFIFTFNPFYSLFLCVAGVVVWRKGNVYARYYVFAWLAYFMGILVLALHNRNLLANSFWINYALEISTLIEVVMLSLAMSYKYKIINEEAQENKLKNELMQERMKQEQAMHEKIIALKDRELAMLMMQMFEKNNLLNDIQKQIQRIHETTAESEPLKNIGKSLQDSIKLDEDWEKFKIHFEQVHPHFFQQLATQYPHLTAHDHKTLAYLRINLGTKDIARLLNIDAKSVKMIKYRLKKKLVLTDEVDLDAFIRGL